MKSKKMDFVPNPELIEDVKIKKFGKDLATALQKIQKDTYDDLDALFRAVPQNFAFMQDDVAANQSAVALVVSGATPTEITMPKPGHILGISIASNAARSAGTLTVDVTKDGTVQTVQAILDGTNTQYHYGTVDRGSKEFSAGDRIGVKITTDASWAPTTADIIVTVFVSF